MKTLLAVSPHLDDAVLSAGASMASMIRGGTQVVVCTVFAGAPKQLSPVAWAFHAECGLSDDAVAVRRREDRRALGRLGARPVHLPFLDAVYRRSGDGWLCTEEGSVVDLDAAAEPQLLADVVAALRRVIRVLTPEWLWTCGAVGGHVDHELTRQAVMACAGERADLFCWEDIPYGLASTAPRAPTSVPVTVRDVREGLESLSHYDSQLRMLWPDGADWRDALAGREQKFCAERIAAMRNGTADTTSTCDDLEA